MNIYFLREGKGKYNKISDLNTGYDFLLSATLIAFRVLNIVKALWGRRLCDGWGNEDAASETFRGLLAISKRDYRSVHVSGLSNSCPNQVRETISKKGKVSTAINSDAAVPCPAKGNMVTLQQ